MANEETSYQKQQQLLDEFGRLDLNKTDINEVTQYSLLKKVLELKGKDFNSLLPQTTLQVLEEDGQKYSFVPPLYFTDSSKETSLESTNELMNYFISRKYSERLLKISNKDIASLVSHVRFLRVPKENNKSLFNKAVEIDFSTYYNKKSLDTILQDTTSCGLSSLKVDVISNTGAYYAYQVNMNLFFANARVLVDNPKYSLLLTTPTLDDSKKPIVYSLIFGWANTAINASEESNVKELYEENLCLMLYLKNYDLQFQPDGSVTLSLNFIGAAESEMDGLNADVLIDKYTLERKTRNLSSETEAKKKKLADAEKAFLEKRESLEKEVNEKEEALKKDNYSNANEKDRDLKYIEYLKNEMTEGNQAKDLEELRKQTKEIEEENNQLILNTKYTQFLGKMYEYNIVYQGKTQFTVNASGSNIQFVPVDVITYKKIDGVGYFGNGVDYSNVYEIVERAQKIDEAKGTSEINLAEQEMIAAFTEPNQTQYSTAKRMFDETVAKGTSGPPITYGNMYFNYVFVGDIIGVAANNAYLNLTKEEKDKSPYENLKFVLGTLDLEQTKTQASPQTGVFFGSILESVGLSTKEQITLDIASIPIAYNVFASWFLKNVVAKKLQTYSFNQFLKDFLNDCVLKTIQTYSTWEAKFVSRNFEKVSTNTSVLRAFQDEAFEIYYTDLPYKIDDVLDSRRINPSDVRNLFLNEKTRKKITPFVDSNNFKKQVYKYGFVYGKFGTLNKTGDLKENLEHGIFHFFVGSTTGILKDIKFVPLAGPGRQEAQILNTTGGSGKPYNEKFNVIQRYDVNITCFGFQYFRPGQIIFVDTSLVGFGKPSDLNSVASKFTLGGYYLVTNVSHNIEGNDFSTSIVAKFTDRGKAKN